jgi:CheY-like chemotaxis protein
MASEYTHRASPQFVDELHSILQHLYDPIVLRESPLLGALGVGLHRGPAALREILLEAIEALKPEPGLRDEASAWRAYRALRHRYVEQFTQGEVADVLALSIRQMRREEKRAVVGLADYLWVRYKVAEKWETPASSINEGAPPSRQQELDWIERSRPSEVVDPRLLVNTAVRVAKPLARALGVNIETASPAELPSVAGQGDSLRQAVLNAVTLAIRWAPRGQVAISLRRDGAAVALTIASQPNGGAAACSAADLAESVDMIRQLLALSDGGLEMHDDNAMGPLSLTLRLPVATQRLALIIDDNTDTLQLYARYLADSAYLLEAVSDPQDAVSRAAALIPDCIVLDVMLPGIDGWELLEHLREHPRTHHIPVIVCTILTEESLALALGAAAFLRKPVSRQDLLAALDAQSARCAQRPRPANG